MKKVLFDELLKSVKEMVAIRKGQEKPTRVTRYQLLQPKAIRAKTGMTQERFASLLGVKLSTYRNWEQGRRIPHGSAKVLLMVADYDPGIIHRAIHAKRETGNVVELAAYKKIPRMVDSMVEAPCPAYVPFDSYLAPIPSAHAAGTHY